ncbi:MAG: 50S ribosomal protein L11 methyltransferase [Rhabdochlamydiaceae bacterium]|nr:50S ribosomal protein L11 methyltransferase [Candidatus Amphrikana amoebophyrae]
MHYLFRLSSYEQQFSAEGQLLLLGFTNIYIVEEEANILLGAYHDEIVEIDFLELIKVENQPEIDWEQQWSDHAEHYIDGAFSYELTNGKKLLMEPGAGFGDLSHPTTILMIQALETYVLDKEVIDLGAGSGVLSLASSLLGAKRIFGIEIDKLGLSHCEVNKKLNQISNIEFSQYLPKECETLKSPIILMNMTLGDQNCLFSANPSIRKIPGTWIVSGILENQVDQLERAFDKKAYSIKSLNGWSRVIFNS